MKTGRPKKQIDQATFEELCRIQCTGSEIASVFRVCEDTVTAWCKRTYGETFSDTYKKFAEDGKSSLRRVQFKLAQKNTAMAIWLGKQYLNQTDKLDLDVRQIDAEIESRLAELASTGKAAFTGEAESEAVN